MVSLNLLSGVNNILLQVTIVTATKFNFHFGMDYKFGIACSEVFIILHIPNLSDSKLKELLVSYLMNRERGLLAVL